MLGRNSPQRTSPSWADKGTPERCQRCKGNDPKRPHHAKNAQAKIFRFLHNADAMGQAGSNKKRPKRM